MTRDSTLVGLVRVMGRPIDCPMPRTGWLTSSPQRTRSRFGSVGVDLVAPIVTAAIRGREALLVFGRKRSEEPYSREDREFVRAVAESLALLLHRSDGDTDTR